MDLATAASIAGIVGAAFVIIFGGKGVVDAVGNLRKRRSIAAAPTAEADHTTMSLDDYKLRVETAHRRLRFGDPTSTHSFAQGEASTEGISLADIYTPLSVATEFGGGEPRNVRPVQLRTPVDEALSTSDARRAVILGDPGAGKSTLVDYLVGEFLRSERDGIPVHVRLSEITSNNASGLWSGVLEVQNGGIIDEQLQRELDETLKSSGGLILLDGLDEVPTDSVEHVTNSIVAMSKSFPSAQIVVTCRSYDYYLTDPQRQLPPEFTKWRLLPFTLDDMLSYVDRWYEALSALKFISTAGERKRNLQDSLRNSPDLENLGATPLLLALMALIHTTEGELPSARSVLYYKAVAHLLADSPQWRAKFVTESIRLDEMLTIATQVAFEVQTREIQSSASHFVGLTIEEIESVVKADLRRRNFDESNHFNFRNAIDARVKRVVQSNGLLIEQAVGHYHFAHKSLQEFLAGLYLLNGADYDLALSLAANPQWHEPLVLMAGYGSRDAHSLFFLTKFIEDLSLGGSASPASEASRLELLLLAGEMLAEIGKDTLRSQRFARLLSNNSGTRPLWWRIVDDLFSARAASVGQRAQLLQVLGQLGDPRFVDSDSNPTSLSARLVSLPCIELSVGDDGRNRPRAKSELVATAPLRHVTIEAFRVSKYLTTNYDYRFFVEEGGYSESTWWSNDALKWLSGDTTFAQELESRTVEWIGRDFRAELEMGKFRMEDVLRDAAAMSRPRTEPFYWRNARYNQANQPVVGINWWEARAYCSWLTHRLRLEGALAAEEQVTIPNEWQWERYARSVDDRRVFPWGSDEATARRAHTRFDGLDLDAATPVGAFPLGQTRDGLLDVAGNVWEWTSSKALPMSVHHDRDRHSVTSVTDVVVRGGSWFSDVDGAVRCGYRGIDLPQNVYYDVGMRIIVSAPSERHRE